MYKIETAEEKLESYCIGRYSDEFLKAKLEEYRVQEIEELRVAPQQEENS